MKQLDSLLDGMFDVMPDLPTLSSVTGKTRRDRRGGGGGVEAQLNVLDWHTSRIAMRYEMSSLQMCNQAIDIGRLLRLMDVTDGARKPFEAFCTVVNQLKGFLSTNGEKKEMPLAPLYQYLHILRELMPVMHNVTEPYTYLVRRGNSHETVRSDKLVFEYLSCLWVLAGKLRGVAFQPGASSRDQVASLLTAIDTLREMVAVARRLETSDTPAEFRFVYCPSPTAISSDSSSRPVTTPQMVQRESLQAERETVQRFFGGSNGLEARMQFIAADLCQIYFAFACQKLGVDDVVKLEVTKDNVSLLGILAERAQAVADCYTNAEQALKASATLPVTAYARLMARYWTATTHLIVGMRGEHTALVLYKLDEGKQSLVHLQFAIDTLEEAPDTALFSPTLCEAYTRLVKRINKASAALHEYVFVQNKATTEGVERKTIEARLGMNNVPEVSFLESMNAVLEREITQVTEKTVAMLNTLRNNHFRTTHHPTLSSDASVEESMADSAASKAIKMAVAYERLRWLNSLTEEEIALPQGLLEQLDAEKREVLSLLEGQQDDTQFIEFRREWALSNSFFR